MMLEKKIFFAQNLEVLNGKRSCCSQNEPWPWPGLLAQEKFCMGLKKLQFIKEFQDVILGSGA